MKQTQVHFHQAFIVAVMLLTLGFGRRLEAIDIVTRFSTEQRASGEITDSTKTEITIKNVGGREVTIPANDIESIEWDAQPSSFKLGQGHEQNGNFDLAIQEYEKALAEVPANKSFLKADVEYHIARVWAKRGFGSADERASGGRKLQAYLDANATFFRFYPGTELLAKLYLSGEDSGSLTLAETKFTLLENSPFSNYQIAGKSGKGQVLLARSDFAKAVQAFDAVTKLPTNSKQDEIVQLEAYVGKANAQQKLGQHQAAIDTLANVVTKAPGTATSLLAKTYVSRGNCFVLMNKPEDALLSFLLVDVILAPQLSADDKHLHAESLYQLKSLWPRVGHPQRAAEAAATLESKYPTSPWTTASGS